MNPSSEPSNDDSYEWQALGALYYDALEKAIQSKQSRRRLFELLSKGREELAAKYADELQIPVPKLVQADVASFRERGPSFFQQILESLPKPPLFTADDCVDWGSRHMAGTRLNESEFDQSLNSFLDYLLNDVDLSSAEFGLGHWDMPTESDIPNTLNNSHPLWNSASGFGVSLSFTRRGSPHNEWNISVHIDSLATDDAMAVVKSRLEEVLPVLISCIRAVFPQRPVLDLAWLEALLNDMSESTGTENTRKSSETSQMESSKPCEPAIPRNRKHFICTCLNAIFDDGPSESRPLLRRISNAITFICEGQKQTRPAISCVLYMAALEALLGDQSQGVSDKLSRRVVTLLEPEGLQRPVAIDHVKQLYNDRSRLVHGDRTEVQSLAPQSLLKIVAATLHAIIEWMQYEARVGNAAIETSFFKELDFAANSGLRMVGAPDDLGYVVTKDQIRPLR